MADNEKKDDQAPETPTKIRSAAEILASAPKIPTDTIHVDDWDTDVKVTGIGKREQRKIQDDAIDAESGKVDEDVVEMSMFAHGVLDPHFTDEEVEKLWETAPRPINQVLLKILELSGNTKKATDVDLAVRTFPEGPGAQV